MNSIPAIAALAYLTCWISPACGAEDSLDEIVVHARRRSENAQAVPIPISVVDGRRIEETGRHRLEDLNQVFPSTNIQFSNLRQTSIALRGLGNNPANDALESSVGVYLDNVYLGRSAMLNIDLVDIDQLELLRGPQGTLFGKNTTAGVLNVSTRSPTFEREGNAELSALTDGGYQVRGMLSGPLVEGNLAGRLAVARTSRAGFVENTTDDRMLNGSERSDIRGQLLWTPTEDLKLRTIVDYGEESSDAGAFVLQSAGPDGGAKYHAALAAAGANAVYDPDFDSVSIDTRQHLDLRQGGGSVEANLTRGETTITSVTAWRSWRYRPASDSDYTDRNVITAAGQRVDDNQWSQELRLSRTAGRWNYVIGAFFFDRHQDNTLYTSYGSDVRAIIGLQVGNANFVGGEVQTHQILNTSSAALFGHVAWQPSSVSEIALGLRATHEDKDVKLDRTSSGLPGFTSNPSFSSYKSGQLDRADDSLGAQFSARYQLRPRLNVYASLAHGAKSGGINPAVPAPGFGVESLYVNPEKVNDAELGFKSMWLDDRLRLEANLFWMIADDYQATQLLQPTSGQTYQQILSNVGRVRSRGAELEFEVRPTSTMEFHLTASFNDAIYRNYHDAPCSAEQLAPDLLPGQKICDLTGQSLVGAPRWIANPTFSFRHSINSRWRGQAQVDYAWRSGYFGSPDNSDLAHVDAVGLVNVRWSLEPVNASSPRVTLWADNLLDERYVIGGLNAAGRLYYYLSTPGQPRTVGATLHVEF
jgi:iron complex outermembrane receptor protein